MKRLRYLAMGLGLSFFMMTTSFANYKEWDHKKSYEDKKEWTITFSQNVDVNQLNDSNIYITDKAGNKIQTKLKSGINENQIIISPLNPYKNSEEYNLYIMDNFMANDKKLSIPVKMKFNYEINEKVTFAEPAIEKKIREVIGKHDGYLYKDELSQITSLDISSKGIIKLDGIENLVNLKKLNISKNNINDLKSIESLLNLEDLDISDNNIEDITSLFKLTNMRSLYARGNKIQKIAAVFNLENIKEIDFADNKINDLSPLSSLKTLTILRLEDNKIINIKPLENLVALRTLMLKNNLITDFSATKSYYFRLNVKDFELNSNENPNPSYNLNDIRYDIKRNYSVYTKGYINISFDYQINDYSSEINVDMKMPDDSYTDRSWKERDTSEFKNFIKDISQEIKKRTGKNIKIFIKDEDNDKTAEYSYDGYLSTVFER